MADRSEELQAYHNQGEQDGAEGEFNPPHDISLLDEAAQSEAFLERMREDNEAYRRGYDNARSQR